MKGLTSKRSKYSLTSRTNCSDRSAPCGRLSFGPSVCGKVKSEMDDAARESKREMSWLFDQWVGTCQDTGRTFSTSPRAYICLAVRLDVQMGSISSVSDGLLACWDAMVVQKKLVPPGLGMNFETAL